MGGTLHRVGLRFRRVQRQEKEASAENVSVYYGEAGQVFRRGCTCSGEEGERGGPVMLMSYLHSPLEGASQYCCLSSASGRAFSTIQATCAHAHRP